MTQPERVPCRNLDCPYNAEALAITTMGVTIRGLCAGCTEDQIAAEAAEERAARVKTLLARVHAGPKLREFSLATYPRDARGVEALAKAQVWLAAFRTKAKQNLILYGPVGTGKTGLAWGLVREVIEEDLVEADLVNFRDLLFDIRQRMGSSNSSFDERLLSVPLLALDDVGAERPTDFARDILATLVERRYQQQLPMIVTSNYKMSELGQRLGHDDPIIGQRITSRFVEGAVQIEIAGKDRRT